MNEHDITRIFLRAAKKHGCLTLKLVVCGVTGFPDWTLFLPSGRVIFVELKGDGGRLSPRQKIMLDKLKELGQDVRVVQTKDEISNLFVA